MLVILLVNIKSQTFSGEKKGGKVDQAMHCHALAGLMVDYTLLRMVNAHISPSSAG